MQREFPASLEYNLLREAQSSPVFIPTIAPVGCFPCTWSTRPDPARQLDSKLEGGIYSLKFSTASFRTYSKQIVNTCFCLSFSVFLHSPSLSLPSSVAAAVSHNPFPTLCSPSKGRGSPSGAVGLSQQHKGICSSRSRHRYQLTRAQQRQGTEHRACQASSSEQIKSKKLLKQFHQLC